MGRSPSALAGVHYLSISYGVSRGYETQGYGTVTIASTSWLPAGKVARGRAMGGGYDMVGSALAQCLREMPDVVERFNRAEYREAVMNSYGVGVSSVDGLLYIDGACGESSVIAAYKLAGVEIQPLYHRGRKEGRAGFIVCVPPEGDL